MAFNYKQILADIEEEEQVVDQVPDVEQATGLYDRLLSDLQDDRVESTPESMVRAADEFLEPQMADQEPLNLSVIDEQELFTHQNFTDRAPDTQMQIINMFWQDGIEPSLGPNLSTAEIDREFWDYQIRARKAMDGYYERKVETDPETQEFIDKLSEQPTGKLGFMDRITDVDMFELMPFVSTAAEISDLVGVATAALRFEDGTESLDDLLLLKEFSDKASQDTDFWYKVADTVVALPAFMGEFMTTAGIYSIGRVAGTKIATEALKKVLGKSTKELLKRRLSRIAIKSVGGIVGGTYQTLPAGGLRIAEGTIERAMPKFGVTRDESKTIQSIGTQEGEDVLTSLAKSAGSQWIETVSEHSGGLLSELVPSAVKNRLMKVALFRAVSKTNPNLSKGKVARLIKRTGYNGIIEEMFEERLGEIGRAALQIEDYKLPTGEQLLVELTSFSIPGAAFSGVQAISERKKSDPKYQKKIDVALAERSKAKTEKVAEVQKNLESAGISEEAIPKYVEDQIGVFIYRSEDLSNLQDEHLEALADIAEAEAEAEAEVLPTEEGVSPEIFTISDIETAELDTDRFDLTPSEKGKFTRSKNTLKKLEEKHPGILADVQDAEISDDDLLLLKEFSDKGSQDTDFWYIDSEKTFSEKGDAGREKYGAKDYGSALTAFTRVANMSKGKETLVEEEVVAEVDESEGVQQMSDKAIESEIDSILEIGKKRRDSSLDKQAKSLSISDILESKPAKAQWWSGDFLESDEKGRLRELQLESLKRGSSQKDAQGRVKKKRAEGVATTKQQNYIKGLLKKIGIDKLERKEAIKELLGVEKVPEELTVSEASQLIEKLLVQVAEIDLEKSRIGRQGEIEAEGVATTNQQNYIKGLLKKIGIDKSGRKEAIKELLGVEKVPEELTFSEASQLIEKLLVQVALQRQQEIDLKKSRKGVHKLPVSLSKSSPRYSYGNKRFTLKFESDLDRAAYLTAHRRQKHKKKKSKRDSVFLNFVMKATGLTKEQVLAAGLRIRNEVIKPLARDTAIPEDQDTFELTISPQIEAESEATEDVPELSMVSDGKIVHLKDNRVRRDPILASEVAAALGVPEPSLAQQETQEIEAKIQAEDEGELKKLHIATLGKMLRDKGLPYNKKMKKAEMINSLLSLDIPSIMVWSVDSKQFEGEVGNKNHLTMTEKGLALTEDLKDVVGLKGEKRGEHRNRTGKEWEDFKEDIKTNGVRDPITINVDYDGDVKIYEGNHRLDAAIELGFEHIPVDIRYFGHAEKQGTVKQRLYQQPKKDDIEVVPTETGQRTQSERKSPDSLSAFGGMLKKVGGMDDNRVSAIEALVEANADYQGISPDQWVQTYINIVDLNGDPAPSALFKKDILSERTPPGQKTTNEIPIARIKKKNPDAIPTLRKAQKRIKKDGQPRKVYKNDFGKWVIDTTGPLDPSSKFYHLTGKGAVKEASYDVNHQEVIKYMEENYSDEDFNEYINEVLKWESNASRNRDTSAIRKNQKTLLALDLSTDCPFSREGAACYMCFIEIPQVMKHSLKLKAGPGEPMGKHETLKYDGQIKEMSPVFVKFLNEQLGGLRIFVGGDYTPDQHANIEIIIADAKSVGLTIKAITKQQDFVKKFAHHSNVNINISTDFEFSKNVAWGNVKKENLKKKADVEATKRPLDLKDTGAVTEFLRNKANELLKAVQDKTKPIKEAEKEFKFSDIEYAGRLALEKKLERSSRTIGRGVPTEEAVRLKKKYGKEHNNVRVRYVAMNKEDAVQSIVDPRYDVITMYHGPTSPLKMFLSHTVSPRYGKAAEKLTSLELYGLAHIFSATNIATFTEQKSKLSQADLDRILGKGKVSLSRFQDISWDKFCCITHKCTNCPTKCGFSKKYISDILPKLLDGVPRAAVEFDQAGKATLYAFTGLTNVADLSHELGHIFRQSLKYEDLTIAEKWAGVKDGSWTDKAEEKFANGFEKWLRGGKAPTSNLKKVFELFKTWLTEIYKTLKGSGIDIKLNKDIEGVFSRMLGGELAKTDEQIVKDGMNQLSINPIANPRMMGALTRMALKDIQNGMSTVKEFVAKMSKAFTDKVIPYARGAWNNAINRILDIDLGSDEGYFRVGVPMWEATDYARGLLKKMDDQVVKWRRSGKFAPIDWTWEVRNTLNVFESGDRFTKTVDKIWTRIGQIAETANERIESVARNLSKDGKEREWLQANFKRWYEAGAKEDDPISQSIWTEEGRVSDEVMAFVDTYRNMKNMMAALAVNAGVTTRVRETVGFKIIKLLNHINRLEGELELVEGNDRRLKELEIERAKGHLAEAKLLAAHGHRFTGRMINEPFKKHIRKNHFTHFTSERASQAIMKGQGIEKQTIQNYFVAHGIDYKEFVYQVDPLSAPSERRFSPLEETRLADLPEQLIIKSGTKWKKAKKHALAFYNVNLEEAWTLEDIPVGMRDMVKTVPLLETDVFKELEHYIFGSARRIAMISVIRELGKKYKDIDDTYELMHKYIEDVRADLANEDIGGGMTGAGKRNIVRAQGVWELVSGITHESGFGIFRNPYVESAFDITTALMLSRGAITNAIGGWYPVAALGGVANTLAGISVVLRANVLGNKEAKEAIADIHMLGAYSSNMLGNLAEITPTLSLGKSSLRSKVKRGTRAFLRIAGFEAINRFINKASGIASQRSLDDSLYHIRAESSKAQFFRMQLARQYNFTPAEIQEMVDGKPSREQLARVVQQFVAQANVYRLNPLDSPLWAQSEWGRAILSLTSFYRSMGYILSDAIWEAKHGSPRKLVTFIVGSAVSNLTIDGIVMDVLTDNDDDDWGEKLYWALLGGGMLGMLGVVHSNIVWASRTGRGQPDWVKPFISVPQLEWMCDTFNKILDVIKYNDLLAYDKLTRQVPAAKVLKTNLIDRPLGIEIPKSRKRKKKSRFAK